MGIPQKIAPMIKKPAAIINVMPASAMLPTANEPNAKK
jgi:hypothetical protein